MTSSRLTDGKGCWPLEQVRVIDGDALEANVMLPFGAVVRLRIRLKGWWADELTGRFAANGKKAKELLEKWVDGKALWMSCPGERRDRYGRIVAHLIHHEKLVNPDDVLGDFQLTESDHKMRRDGVYGPNTGPAR